MCDNNVKTFVFCILKYLHIIILLLSYLQVFSNQVSEEQARLIATNFFHNRTVFSSSLKSSHISISDSVSTYYTFNFKGGGWIIVSANDLVTPILAYSEEGSISDNDINPAAKLWLEDVETQIKDLSRSGSQSISMSQEWVDALSNNFNVGGRSVSPLLKSKWNQSQFYNDSCPKDLYAPISYNGHVPAGCVAIAMAQIMNYYSYPQSGSGSNSYYHPKYGTLSANFENTNYNWKKMVDSAYNPNADVAKLIYHCGVSVNTSYDSTSSYANSSSIKRAFTYFFKYTDSIETYNRSDDSINHELWIARIKNELDARRPVFYYGYGTDIGHAFLCDGYDNSFPTKFHINWGWGGKYDGYYNIGLLNPSSESSNLSYNISNGIFTNIKPGAPSMLGCQIVYPNDQQMFSPDTLINIIVEVTKGTPKSISLYIDDIFISTISKSPYSFSINSNQYISGQHDIKVVLSDGINTVNDYRTIRIESSCWRLQKLIPVLSENVQVLSIVDSNVVWATLWGSLVGLPNLFARTSDGGVTWDTGRIINPVVDSLKLLNIWGINSQKAYACFVPWNKQGGALLYTENGGKDWIDQKSVDFSNSAANWVGFFDENNGICMGDPYQNDFLIYITNDGGNTWNKVPDTNIPDAIENENSYQNNFTIYKNNIWFITQKGRLFRSSDKGLNWVVTDSIFTSKTSYYVRFKDSVNVFVRLLGSSKAIYRTNDGGNSWTKKYSNQYLLNIEYIPGTDSIWINHDGSIDISTDDGKTFYNFEKSFSVNTIKFLSSNVGWAGGYYNSDKQKGTAIFKWIGSFPSIKTTSVKFEVCDKNNYPVSNAKININNKADTTDTTGISVIKVDNFGKAIPYSLSKSGFLTSTGVFTALNDTTLRIKLESKNSNVTFNVTNHLNQPAEGITIFFNDSMKNTDMSGKVKFYMLSIGNTYVFSAMDKKEYYGHGTIKIGESDNFINIKYVLNDIKNPAKEPDILYPNPVSEVLHIMSDNIITSLSIYNLSGLLMYKSLTNSNIVQLPVQFLKNDVYILQVNKGDLINTYKLVIMHK